MQLLLFDMNAQLCEAWEKEFADYDTVTVHNVMLEDAPAADCLVAAGNSFGIMDGGLDAAMALQFPDVVANVHEGIVSDYKGELPVGSSIIVPTGDETFPWMAYTPTMRYPRKITAELVYDAMRGMLLAVIKWNEDLASEKMIAEMTGEDAPARSEIVSIACPGLGTLSGGVGAFTGAKMMRMAWDTIYGDEPHGGSDWRDIEGWLAKLYGRA
jgi:O-acetyl-ADP-ribose deacetylase (regulator of RNase III)